MNRTRPFGPVRRLAGILAALAAALLAAARGPGRVRPARAPRCGGDGPSTAPRADRHCRRHARLADRPHRRGCGGRGRRRGSVLGPARVGRRHDAAPSA